MGCEGEDTMIGVRGARVGMSVRVAYLDEVGLIFLISWCD